MGAYSDDVTRRHVLSGVAATTLIGSTAANASNIDEGKNSKTFVLVHGAWHGGWCYQRVADSLRRRGHRVFTPTLTGLGDRSHLINGTINLSTHVNDVLNLVKWEGLEDIILCGHSYGGMVITGVAANLKDKVSAIVYLDAFLPGENQSLMDMSSSSKQWLESAANRGGTMLAPIPAAAFGVNAQDQAWVDRLCVNQPIATFIEKNKSTLGLSAIKRKHYIVATGYMQGGLFKAAYSSVKNDPAWTTEVFTCGHDVMIDEPEKLAESLDTLM